MTAQIRFSPDGKWLAVQIEKDNGTFRNGDGGPLAICDASSATLVRTVGHKVSLNFSFSPDSKWVLVSEAEGTANLLDVSSGKTLQTFADVLSDVAISPNGHTILVKGEQIRVYQLRSNR